MKYCSHYSCGRVLPEGFSDDTCPYCNTKTYSWNKDRGIKELPAEALEIVMKCHKCDSEEELSYREIYKFGSRDQYSTGNEFTCKTCVDAFNAEIARNDAMNYIVINPDSDEVDFYENKDGVENYFDHYFDDNWPEGDDPLSGFVVLKIEKLDRLPTAADFYKRNVIQHDYEWYIVEDVSEPEYEYNGDHSISW